MTDENLDKLMRKVLIDALRMEWSDALNESPTMSTTKEFQHQMKVMLRAVSYTHLTLPTIA